MYTVDALCLAAPPQVTAALKVRVEALHVELAKVEASAAGHRADFERERDVPTGS
jgi:hypothetical protein